MRVTRRALAAALLLVGSAACDLPVTEPDLAVEPEFSRLDRDRADFSLTILHNNDGESELLPGPEFGGIARFGRTVDDLRADVKDGCEVRCGTILVSSGDNFLAGPEFSASLANGVPFFDAVGQDLIGYDAFAIGNHEFDFGPDVLADYIQSFGWDAAPWLSANLDFSGEPRLARLERRHRIAGSTIVEVDLYEADDDDHGAWRARAGRRDRRNRGRGGDDVLRVGIIGATTPALTSISSPRNVVVMEDVASAIQREVFNLRRRGVNAVVLISHLQSLTEDMALLPMLSGIDVAVAGGGDELLANAGDRLIPGDESEVFGSYPLVATDRRGRQVPVVTTSGQYRYVGRLDVELTRDGRVVGFAGGPVRVEGAGDPELEAMIEAPVEAAVATLQATVVGGSEVVLDGRRSQVRTVETNEGNLIADAILWQANALATSFGVTAADVGIQNGGGIRNDAEFPAGPITEFDTFDWVPFANFVSIVPDISREQFKEILENAVSAAESVNGRFAQVAGVTFTWDPSGTPQQVQDDGTVMVPGSRIIDVTLASGQALVVGGVVQPGAPIAVATIDFLARGGDQYPYRGAAFTSVGVTYQQAVRNYIADALGGTVTAADYPAGGEGRITRLGS